MSTLTRGLAIFRPLARNRVFTYNGFFSPLSLRYESAFLRLSNTTYPFPPSPPQNITPEDTGPNTATFLEEPTIEYGTYEESNSHLENAIAHSPEVQAAQVILRLITKGDLNEALIVKEEYDKLRIKIAPDRAFLDAAISELSKSNPDSWRKRFAAWWSLTPLNEYLNAIPPMCTRLMDHSYCIPLLMDFCIICAKAGHAQVVEQTQLFEHIFRYGNPNATTLFLTKMEDEARKIRNKEDPKAWMSMRNLAIRMHFVAGRREIARQMFKAAVKLGFDINPFIQKIVEANTSYRRRLDKPINTRTLYPYTIKEKRRSIPDLARELRILRQIVSSRGRPPHFEVFLARFIDEYENLGRRSRAIRMLREKVFRDATLPVRARWVAGEQLAYSMRKKPIAVLRTFMHYCLADSVLAAEARPILLHWRRKQYKSTRQHKDWKLSLKPVNIDYKIWPSDLSLSLAWKAILQLCKKEDVSRLYDIYLTNIRRAQQTRKTQKRLPNKLARSDPKVLKLADETYLAQLKDPGDPISIPPATFPGERCFHHFVVAFATRFSPREGSKVIKDMQELGYKPSRATWGALAGAYARSGDMQRVLRILNHLNWELSKGQRTTCKIIDSLSSRKGYAARKKKRGLRALLTTYNSVLRGLTEAGMYKEARRIKWRMQKRGFLKGGMDKRTKAILHRLSRHEKGKFDEMLMRRRTVFVDGRTIFVSTKRADWLKEIRQK